MRNALRNLIVVVSAFAAGGALAAFIGARFAQDSVVQLLKDIWPLQAILVGLVTALFYRLNSDTAYVAGMPEKARRQLSSMVRKKSRRLGFLIVAIAIPVVLSRLPASWFKDGTYAIAVFAAITLASASTLLCVYLWPMWGELRQFISDAEALKEDDERRQKEVERLRGKSAS